jgi:hypothetical protein
VSKILIKISIRSKPQFQAIKLVSKMISSLSSYRGQSQLTLNSRRVLWRLVNKSCKTLSQLINNNPTFTSISNRNSLSKTAAFKCSIMCWLSSNVGTQCLNSTTNITLTHTRSPNPCKFIKRPNKRRNKQLCKGMGTGKCQFMIWHRHPRGRVSVDGNWPKGAWMLHRNHLRLKLAQSWCNLIILAKVQ